MKQRLSASKLKLARKCVFPWVSDLEWNDPPRWSGVIGTGSHTFAETGKLPSLEMVGTDARGKERNADGLTKRQVEIIRGTARQYSKWFSAQGQDLTNLKREVPFWYSPATGDWGELPRGEHRDYSAAPANAFCGTIDMVGDPDWAPWDFADIKTGWSPDPPDKSDQMRFFAVIFRKMRSRTEVKCGILSIREKDYSFMPGTIDELTLDTMEGEMRRVHLAVQKGKGPTPGNHCNVCPIKESCEASTYERPNRSTRGKGQAA